METWSYITIRGEYHGPSGNPLHWLTWVTWWWNWFTSLGSVHCLKRDVPGYILAVRSKYFLRMIECTKNPSNHTQHSLQRYLINKECFSCGKIKKKTTITTTTTTTTTWFILDIYIYISSVNLVELPYGQLPCSTGKSSTQSTHDFPWYSIAMFYRRLDYWWYWEVSWNRGTRKSSIYRWIFLQKEHPFWGTPISRNPHLWGHS